MKTDFLLETHARAPVADSRAGKYLVFYVGDEEFAVQVLSVREIIGLQDITAVPHAPTSVKGIINLRGKVVPVVDLRLKFAIPATEFTARTCIVVVTIAAETGDVLIGAIVDSVSEVANITADEIEDAPGFGQGADVRYLAGIAKTKGKVRLLLNIDRVLEVAAICALGQSN